jgi:hypothetical protein
VDAEGVPCVGPGNEVWRDVPPDWIDVVGREGFETEMGPSDDEVP